MARSLQEAGNSRHPQAAKSGTLATEAFEDLVALQTFMEDRDRLLHTLLGRRLRRSKLRDDLIRMVVIDFGRGQLRNITSYQEACRHMDSPSATRGELHLLSDLGLVVLTAQPGKRRSVLVQPTQRLVDWYSTQMPSLFSEVQAVFIRRGMSIVPNAQSLR